MGLLLAGGLALTGGAALWWLATRRHPPLDYPLPEALVIDLPEDTSVTSAPEGALEIRWLPERLPASIRVGTQPGAFERELPLPDDLTAGRATYTDLDPQTRHYFEIVFADGGRVVVAERVLEIDGAGNFRDIGGYPAQDGRRVRWGRVYRSGYLAELTPAGLAQLESLGVRLTCDLRSAEEVRMSPDRLPDGTRYLQLPVVARENRLARLYTLFIDRRRMLVAMPNTYRYLLIDANPTLFGRILTELADEANLPALIHCSAGKDRTGVAVALLYMLLGVPEEIIIADYSLSNRAYPFFRRMGEGMVERVRRLRVTVDDITPLLTAHPDTLRATLEHIREKYGTIEDYLLGPAGMDRATLDRLRDMMLE